MKGMTVSDFDEGVRYALTYLRDEVYGEGITETDLWKEFVEEKENENA